MRRGMMLGSGKRGYYNVIGRDPYVHSQSARGMKQPQRMMPSYKLQAFPETKTPIRIGRVLDTAKNPRFNVYKYKSGVIIGGKSGGKTYGEMTNDELRESIKSEVESIQSDQKYLIRLQKEIEDIQKKIVENKDYIKQIKETIKPDILQIKERINKHRTEIKRKEKAKLDYADFIKYSENRIAAAEYIIQRNIEKGVNT